MSITKENSLQSQINYLKRRINCLCNSILGLEAGGSGGGSGELEYLVYTALLTQTDTNAPVATVLKNTLDGTVVWSYVEQGVFSGTLPGAFTENKTVLFSGGSGGEFGLFWIDANTIAAISNTSAGSPENNQLNKSTVEIRVYP